SNLASATDAPAPALPPPPPPSVSKSSSAVSTAPVAAPVPVAAPIELNNPRGIAVGKNGTIYVGTIGDGMVYQMTPAGNISALAGGAERPDVDGTGKNAGFTTPTGLAVGSDGTVYVADGDSDTIRKITPAGVVTTLAGKPSAAGFADGKGALAQFAGATALAV